ncbi:hypothetical protein B0O99DRAFT_615169 [Bisporella sp. PMI_857]|nr:hypothetical protein B0O99DRAFT_615169 [Bisporella sp. PMI_857]
MADDGLPPPCGSARNSQRNSSAVSECQEELSNTITLLSISRRRFENQPPSLTDTNITAPVFGREGCPLPYVRPQWEMDLVTPFPT